MPNEHLDLWLLEHDITLVFNALIPVMPEVDYADPFDGENLQLFAGKRFEEVPEIIEESNFFPFFALVPVDVGKYYLAGYMLYFIRLAALARDHYATHRMPQYFDMEYVTLIMFLRDPDVVRWISSIPVVAGLIRRFIHLVVNTPGLGRDGQDFEEIDGILPQIQTGADSDARPV